jgi:hypothetical protein
MGIHLIQSAHFDPDRRNSRKKVALVSCVKKTEVLTPQDQR